ncbi:uncharacterized protein CELE_Y57G11C.1131 [Caenorhabditis elegans]|uniref:Uncharacterized protein n=1 Tax=Caenorhabditis elegans TaxID=6239 RepID=C6KRQ2_CAEEL|nr:Uncharacterized protein CELE_Y57G11C.1131 [Caenorhabditis elegans]CAZ65543.1 Uncharacterized protein CELE_Y57G11C.1131 [Caenorhabditis elegans]|eukprot:NP_001255841.1 Uncharacterized protein CELE_Y57G11C.1131 [Caenorhabditis elegans]
MSLLMYLESEQFNHNSIFKCGSENSELRVHFPSSASDLNDKNATFEKSLSYHLIINCS